MWLLNTRVIMLIILCILLSVYSYYNFVMFQDKSKIIPGVTINGKVNLKSNSLNNTNKITANKICIGHQCLEASHLKAIKKTESWQRVQTCIHDPANIHKPTCIEKNQLLNLQNLWPIGSITLYYGDKNKIPIGWGLCDGKSYPLGDGTGRTWTTPDLTDRFLKGADERANQGWGDLATPGGNKTTTLQANNIPTHVHVIQSGSLGPSGGSVSEEPNELQYIDAKPLTVDTVGVVHSINEMNMIAMTDKDDGCSKHKSKETCENGGLCKYNDTDEKCKDITLSIHSGPAIDIEKNEPPTKDINNTPPHKKAYYIMRIGEQSCIYTPHTPYKTEIHTLEWETRELTKLLGQTS